MPERKTIRVKDTYEEERSLYASTYRMKIIDALDHRKTPSMLEKQTGIKMSHVSRTLKELEERKLVVCLTPSARKGKMYQRTELGEKTLQEVKNPEPTAYWNSRRSTRKKR